MHLLTDQAAWASFLTLAFLEIVLGVDNIVFVSLLAQRLPEAQQAKARYAGVFIALVLRILMLFGLGWIMGLTEPVFTLVGRGFSWKDLILLGGGLFLMVKATLEIHKQVEGPGSGVNGKPASFVAIVGKIIAIDLVFSLDSIITAVGMTPHIPVMVAAIFVAIVVMVLLAQPISGFILKHPTTKMLALSFLILIAVTLIAEGFGQKFPKGYLYFAIGFSLFVEILNLYYARKKQARLAAETGVPSEKPLNKPAQAPAETAE
jgi:predicted tellurium resistance membrane protein TerC